MDQGKQDFHLLLQDPRTLELILNPGNDSDAFLKGFQRVLEGALKGDKYKDPSKTLQSTLQRPLQRPSWGPGFSVARMKVLTGKEHKLSWDKFQPEPLLWPFSPALISICRTCSKPPFFKILRFRGCLFFLFCTGATRSRFRPGMKISRFHAKS